MMSLFHERRRFAKPIDKLACIGYTMYDRNTSEKFLWKRQITDETKETTERTKADISSYLCAIMRCIRNPKGGRHDSSYSNERTGQAV